MIQSMTGLDIAVAIFVCLFAGGMLYAILERLCWICAFLEKLGAFLETRAVLETRTDKL